MLCDVGMYELHHVTHLARPFGSNVTLEGVVMDEIASIVANSEFLPSAMVNLLCFVSRFLIT